MHLVREGLLRETDPSRGDILSLSLGAVDTDTLVRSEEHSTMSRFSQFRSPVKGWGSEDKVHVRLGNVAEAGYRGSLANLSLDPGGDLYFVIWDDEPLRACTEIITPFENLEEFAGPDAARLGDMEIEVVRILGLNQLGETLRRSDQGLLF